RIYLILRIFPAVTPLLAKFQALRIDNHSVRQPTLPDLLRQLSRVRLFDVDTVSYILRRNPFGSPLRYIVVLLSNCRHSSPLNSSYISSICVCVGGSASSNPI